MACFFSGTEPTVADPATLVNKPFDLIECNWCDMCILKCSKCKCILWDENEEEYWYRTFGYNGKGHKSHTYASTCVNKDCKSYAKPICQNKGPPVRHCSGRIYRFDNKPISFRRK